MHIKNKLGLRIKELRKQRGFSQEKLSELIDVSQNSLSKIELGDNFLTSDTLEKLLNVFNITACELFDFEHIKPSKNLIDDINRYFLTVQEDKNKLIVLHKIVQALAKE